MPIPQNLSIYLHGGERFDVNPAYADVLLNLMLEQTDQIIRFDTIDDKTVYVYKSAVSRLETHRALPVSAPIGFLRQEYDAPISSAVVASESEDDTRD